ncbi:MAG: adenylate/guanylate cyclase domain-containing protein [Acidobacteriota bacterium]
MVARKTQAIAAWLIDGARSAQEPQAVLAELCGRLVAAGVPLWRVAVFVRTLHPQVMGRRFLWVEGAGVSVTESPHEVIETAEFRDSPVAWVYSEGRPLRRRLCDPGGPVDFPLLAELKAEGVTDYLATPLIFTDGAVHAATWTTRQPQGFKADEVDAIEALVPPLTRVAEVRALRRIARNLLDTYVGPHAGARILSGQIRRGDAETIRAAIWLSDMRGFTTLADTLPPRFLIDLLNRYFDCQVPAILRHGGEVLKFIGDGLLAIFPLAGAAAPEVCGRALAAAVEARDAIAALAGAAEGEIGRVRFGVALHLGEVLYGNIGGGNRLDFTCIGPAVNLAARIEALAGRLGRTVLASGDFARHCGGDLVSVGAFTLPGFRAAQTIFGRRDESA